MTAGAWKVCPGCDCRDACKWARVCMAEESAKLMDEATDPAASSASAWPLAQPPAPPVDRQEVQR